MNPHSVLIQKNRPIQHFSYQVTSLILIPLLCLSLLAAKDVAASSEWPLHTTITNRTGPNVWAIQYLIRQQGHPIAVDGIYGEETANYVEIIQAVKGLDEDGKVGSETWQKGLMVTLQRGNQGHDNAVRALQYLLRYKYNYDIGTFGPNNDGIDGDFGQKTYDAVVQFQDLRGIQDSSGVVGNQTWLELVCLDSPIPTHTPTAIPTSSYTPTRTPTLIPLHTPTLTRTPTPTLTRTPTPTLMPTHTPTPFQSQPTQAPIVSTPSHTVTPNGAGSKFLGLYLPAIVIMPTPTTTPTPIEIIVSAPLSDDTYIASGRPTQQNSENKRLLVGYYQSNGSNEVQSLLRFDLTAIPIGSQIVSATLLLTLVSYPEFDRDIGISVSRLTGAWNQNISWDEYNEAIDHSTIREHVVNSQTVSIAAAAGVKSWDVKEMVQAEIDDNVISDIGFLLKSNETSGEHYRIFWSEDCSCSDFGRLVIEYRSQ